MKIMENISVENLYDVIIVGAGPAGLSAAIYMARAKYKVLVLEKEKIGGQITITSEVVNYPGVFETSGSELTSTMHKQAEAFGAEFQFAEVLDVNSDAPIKKITTNQGEFQALGVILALGANPRKLGFQGETEFQGRGVAYCATCDGEFFKNMEVYVVGGGFAAVEEGIFLTKYASHVHMLVRGDSFSCAKTVADKALEHKKITVNFNTEVEKVEGTHTLNSITILDKKTGETRTVLDEKGLGVFVFAGYVPNTQWLSEIVELEKGYIVTNPQGETNIKGIYAAGDVRIKELRQVVTAVSDGATAATTMEKYVEALHHELDLPELTVEKNENCECGQPKDGHTHYSANPEVDGNEFISGEMIEQLQPVLAQFQDTVLVKTQLGSNELAQELGTFAKECGSISPKIKFETTNSEEPLSYMELCKEDGSSIGVRYQAIPGGHEFNSFLIGLFNLSGAGKQLDATVSDRIKGLKSADLKVFLTLSCTMCPDVVVASQRIALENPNVNATMIDIAHNQELREKYKIMSVPCLVINDEEVHFGKKQMDEIIELLEKNSK